MTTRLESASATRRALLDAAGRFLDEGGPDAVTLRAVGAAAGVSRGAPYGHFADKSHLLAVLATEGWSRLADRLVELRDDANLSPEDKLRAACREMVDLGMTHRNLYETMFSPPDGPTPELLSAAGGAQDVFLDLVGQLANAAHTRATAALLLAGAHGIASMASAGHLGSPKWGVDEDDLVRLLIERVA